MTISSMIKAIRQLLPIVAILAALPAQAAFAASPNDVIRDCANDGTLNGDYSRGELNAALGNVKGDVAEYTDCRAAIGAALSSLGGGGPKAKLSKKGGGPGASSDDLNADGKVTPAERRAAKRARKRHERRQLAAIGDGLSPGGPSALGSEGAGSGGMPAALVLALIALAGLGIGTGTWYAARRYPAVANALSRVPLPLKRS
jgi:hypothetical protein